MLAEELLSRGQNVNSKDLHGLTLLHMAVLDENVDAVKFLLDHGAVADESSIISFQTDSDNGQKSLTALELARYFVEYERAVSMHKLKKIETLLSEGSMGSD